MHIIWDVGITLGKFLPNSSCIPLIDCKLHKRCPIIIGNESSFVLNSVLYIGLHSVQTECQLRVFCVSLRAETL